MFKHLIASFFIFQLLLIYSQQETETLKVSHTVLVQETYYNDTNNEISKSFIDFMQYRIYNITKERIYSNKQNQDPKFKLIWKDKIISIDCIPTNDLKCAEIDLGTHEFITFDFDRLIADLGGIFSYLLVLYGFFSLRRGFVYFNLTVIFYCSFGFILFMREFFELLELNKLLNSEYDTSYNILITVFSFSLIICIMYGYICYLSKYLKYVTFGFINGLFFSKIINYIVIKFLVNNYFLVYLLIELFLCLIFIILFVFLQNKYVPVNIINICIIASYGIIYGMNILFGGLPFLPFFIIAKEIKEEEYLFPRLVKENLIECYGIFYVLLIIYGYWKNDINYQIATNRKIKNK